MGLNISDAFWCPVCSDALECVTPLPVKRLVYVHLESVDVWQIMGSKYHAQLKYFEITDGALFGIKKKKKKKNLQVSSFSNMYLILQWDPNFLSYSNLKWSRNFLDTEIAITITLVIAIAKTIAMKH